MDAKQFEKEYKLNRRKIYYMIGRYISDACTIEDLTQHTFMKAWLYRETFRGDSSYTTWLHRIAINTALNHLKDRWERKGCFDDKRDVEACGDAKSTLATVISDDELTRLEQAICKLPEGSKDVVVLNIIHGYSYDECAAALGIPIGTVRSRLHRARFMLKDLLV